MSDFDELSRRNWEYRRTQKQGVEPPDPDENSPTGGLFADDDDVDQVERRSPLNPSWRKERTTRSRGRRTTGAIYASPQEFQLWLQKGGWMWGAVGALLVVGALVFVLMQNRDAESNTTTAAQPSDSIPTSNAEGAGINTDTGAADDTDDGGVPTLPEQATLTPAPPTQPTQNLGSFVVANTGTQGLFLRAEPNTNGAVVETLPEGTQVQQIGEDTIGANYVWRHVRSPGGQEGWVAVDWLQPAP